MKKALNLTVPIFENFTPVLHNLYPFLQYSGEYVHEFQAFFANVTAASEAAEPNSDIPGQGPKQHLLTTMAVLSPESLAVYPNRIGTDRADAYPHPGAYSSLASGLPVFSSSSCADSAPSVSGPTNETVSEELLKQLTHPPNAGESPVANEPGAPNQVAAPSCVQQGPFTFNGQTSQFAHVVYPTSTSSK